MRVGSRRSAETWHRRSPGGDSRRAQPQSRITEGLRVPPVAGVAVARGRIAVRHNALACAEAATRRRYSVHPRKRPAAPARHCPHRSCPFKTRDVTDSSEQLASTSASSAAAASRSRRGEESSAGWAPGRMDSTKFKELGFGSASVRSGTARSRRLSGAAWRSRFGLVRSRAGADGDALVGAAGWDEGCGAAGAGAGSAGSVGVGAAGRCCSGGAGVVSGAPGTGSGATEGPVGAASGCGGPAAARPGSAASARSRTRQAGARRCARLLGAAKAVTARPALRSGAGPKSLTLLGKPVALRRT